MAGKFKIGQKVKMIDYNKVYNKLAKSLIPLRKKLNFTNKNIIQVTKLSQRPSYKVFGVSDNVVAIRNYKNEEFLILEGGLNKL